MDPSLQNYVLCYVRICNIPDSFLLFKALFLSQSSAELEYLQQEPSGSQRQKYLLFGPLEKNMC